MNVLTVGRISVDIYGQQPGNGLADDQTFAKAVGGTSTNVAVAVARLGHSSAVYTKVGDDSFGTFVTNKLKDFGVDTSFVGRVSGGRTPVVIAGLADPGEPDFVFYRDEVAPDMQLVAGEVSDQVVRDVDVFWISATAMAQQPARTTISAMLETRNRQAHTILDLDYRPSFWKSREEATEVISAAVQRATICIGNREECSVATGLPVTTTPDEFAQALLAQGVSIAVIKQGADGVLVVTKDSREVVPGIPVEVVCGLGSGDAFGGSFVHGLLSGLTPEQAVHLGNAAGAIVASRLLCSDAMPTVAELDEFLAKSGK